MPGLRLVFSQARPALDELTREVVRRLQQMGLVVRRIEGPVIVVEIPSVSLE